MLFGFCKNKNIVFILDIYVIRRYNSKQQKPIKPVSYTHLDVYKRQELWLSALQERNNVTHSYNRKIAMGIITQAKQKFYKMFCELKEEIDRNWI